MQHVRQALIRLAHENPTIRALVLPLTRQADKWKSLPPGWDQGSVDKFWESLTGENKHHVTKCISQMEGKVDDPGAFCGSLADKVDPGWREKTAFSQTDQFRVRVDMAAETLQTAARQSSPDKSLALVAWALADLSDGLRKLSLTRHADVLKRVSSDLADHAHRNKGGLNSQPFEGAPS